MYAVRGGSLPTGLSGNTPTKYGRCIRSARCDVKGVRCTPSFALITAPVTVPPSDYALPRGLWPILRSKCVIGIKLDPNYLNMRGILRMSNKVQRSSFRIEERVINGITEGSRPNLRSETAEIREI